MLYIFKRFFFSFLSVFFFFFFFCILDFKSQNNENCQRVLRSILVLCIVWMFKFAWLHDIIKEKNVNFFVWKLLSTYHSEWCGIYIYRVLPWRCIEYFCSRFFWVENIHKPARQSSGNRLKTCLNLLKLVEGSSCFIFWFYGQRKVTKNRKLNPIVDKPCTSKWGPSREPYHLVMFITTK